MDKKLNLQSDELFCVVGGDLGPDTKECEGYHIGDKVKASYKWS